MQASITCKWHDHNQSITVTVIAISEMLRQEVKPRQSFTKVQKKLWLALAPTRVKVLLVFTQENPEKDAKKKQREKGGQIPLLFDQQITTARHGMKPIPK